MENISIHNDVVVTPEIEIDDDDSNYSVENIDELIRLFEEKHEINLNLDVLNSRQKTPDAIYGLVNGIDQFISKMTNMEKLEYEQNSTIILTSSSDSTTTAANNLNDPIIHSAEDDNEIFETDPNLAPFKNATENKLKKEIVINVADLPKELGFSIEESPVMENENSPLIIIDESSPLMLLDENSPLMLLDENPAYETTPNRENWMAVISVCIQTVTLIVALALCIYYIYFFVFLVKPIINNHYTDNNRGSYRDFK